MELTWENLSKEKKEDCFKYLLLLKRFNKNPNLLNAKHKKWVLENSDLPTYLIPCEILIEEKLLL